MSAKLFPLIAHNLWIIHQLFSPNEIVMFWCFSISTFCYGLKPYGSFFRAKWFVKKHCVGLHVKHQAKMKSFSNEWVSPVCWVLELEASSISIISQLKTFPIDWVWCCWSSHLFCTGLNLVCNVEWRWVQSFAFLSQGLGFRDVLLNPPFHWLLRVVNALPVGFWTGILVDHCVGPAVVCMFAFVAAVPVPL